MTLEQPVLSGLITLGLREPENVEAAPVPRPECEERLLVSNGEAIGAEVRDSENSCWLPEISGLPPASTATVLLEYRNFSEFQADNVTLRAQLPSGLQLVPYSTRYGTRAQPDGTPASNNIADVGINIGSYRPGGGTWATFRVKVSGELSCGRTALPIIYDLVSDATSSGANELSVSSFRFC